MALLGAFYPFYSFIAKKERMMKAEDDLTLMVEWNQLRRSAVISWSLYLQLLGVILSFGAVYFPVELF